MAQCSGQARSEQLNVGHRPLPSLPMETPSPPLTQKVFLQQGDFQVAFELVKPVRLSAVEIRDAGGHDGPRPCLQGRGQ